MKAFLRKFLEEANNLILMDAIDVVPCGHWQGTHDLVPLLMDSLPESAGNDVL